MTTPGLLTACGAELVGSGAKPLFSVFLFLMPTMDRTFFRLFFFSFFRKNFLFFFGRICDHQGDRKHDFTPGRAAAITIYDGKKRSFGTSKGKTDIDFLELVYLHLTEFHPHLILLCSWESVTVA